MILVDTSIWISHFRKKNALFSQLLLDEKILIHPWIIGELACGNFKNRKEILLLLNSLPQAQRVEQTEILFFIEKQKLMGKGLGFIDIHLLASALVSDALLWTEDRNLQKATQQLNAIYKPE